MIRKTIKGGDFKSQMVGELVFDQVPEEGSFNPVTSDAVAKIAGGVADLDAIVPEGASEENKLATAADVAGVQGDVDNIEGKIPSDTSTANKLVNESGLQDAIDNASESWSTGFTPKGESSVSDLNDLATQSNGDSYIVTDSGTLTDGSLAVVAGDQVAWDATNSVWYKLPQYALNSFANNIAASIAPAFNPTRTSENPYKAGESVTYTDGNVYTFKVDHYGAWDATHVVLFDKFIDKFHKLDSDIGVYDIGTTHNTLDPTYSRVMAVYPINPADIDKTFICKITEKSQNGGLAIRVTSSISPYGAAILQNAGFINSTLSMGGVEFTIDQEAKPLAKYIMVYNETSDLLVSFKCYLATKDSMQDGVKKIQTDGIEPLTTALGFSLDSLKDNTYYEITTSGIIRTTTSSKYCSNLYRCRAGEKLRYTLSNDTAILATYDKDLNFVSAVSGTGYSNYITGEKTFSENECYFAVSGVMNRIANYSLSYVSNFGDYEEIKSDLEVVKLENTVTKNFEGMIDYGTTYSQFYGDLSRVVQFYPVENAADTFGYEIKNINCQTPLYILATSAKNPFSSSLLQIISTIQPGTDIAKGTFQIDPSVRASANYIMVGSRTYEEQASFYCTFWKNNGTIEGGIKDNAEGIDVLNSNLALSQRKDVIEANDSIYVNGVFRKLYNPYKGEWSRVLTGQLHCHDRQMNSETEEPEFIDATSRAEILQSHKSAGYDWMVVTNYSSLGEVYPTNPSDIPSDFIYLFSSMEVPVKPGSTYKGVYELTKHICTYNTNDPTTDRADGWYNHISLQDYATMKAKEGCLTDLAHPFWVDTYADPEVLREVKGGVNFCEVWNGLSEKHRELHDNGDNMKFPEGKDQDFAWEALIDNGCRCWAIAVTDIHSSELQSLMKRGCVKVLTNEFSREAIIDALLNGHFYASSNVDVSLDSLSFDNGVLSIGTGSADATTVFMKEGGEVLDTITGASASYTMDGSEKYVRAVVSYPTESVDYLGNTIYEKIWIQPIIALPF